MYGPNNGTIHVGDKSSDFQYWERTQLCFHDFEDQPTDGTQKTLDFRVWAMSGVCIHIREGTTVNTMPRYRYKKEWYLLISVM
jgi:hypothetical protein